MFEIITTHQHSQPENSKYFLNIQYVHYDQVCKIKLLILDLIEKVLVKKQGKTRRVLNINTTV